MLLLYTLLFVEVSREFGKEVVIQSERDTHQHIGGDVVVPQEFVHVVAFATYLHGEPRHRAALQSQLLSYQVANVQRWNFVFVHSRNGFVHCQCRHYPPNEKNEKGVNLSIAIARSIGKPRRTIRYAHTLCGANINFILFIRELRSIKKRTTTPLLFYSILVQIKSFRCFWFDCE